MSNIELEPNREIIIEIREGNYALEEMKMTVEEIEQEMRVLELKIHRLAGITFDVNNLTATYEAMYNQMGLPHELDEVELAQQYPIALEVLKYRYYRYIYLMVETHEAILLVDEG